MTSYEWLMFLFKVVFGLQTVNHIGLKSLIFTIK